MAHATAVLVPRAVSPPVAAAVERAVVTKAVVGAVDSLPARSHPARDGGVVQALVGVSAGLTERDEGVVGVRRIASGARERGGGSQRQPAYDPAARAAAPDRSGDGIENVVVHDVPPFVGFPARPTVPRGSGAALYALNAQARLHLDPAEYTPRELTEGNANPLVATARKPAALGIPAAAVTLVGAAAVVVRQRDVVAEECTGGINAGVHTLLARIAWCHVGAA